MTMRGTTARGIMARASTRPSSWSDDLGDDRAWGRVLEQLPHGVNPDAVIAEQEVAEAGNPERRRW